MLINAIIDFGALLSLIVVFKIQRFVYLVIGNDLNLLNGMNHFRLTFQCPLVLLMMQN